MEPDVFERLEVKTAQHRLLHKLESEYGLAPRVAQAVLEEAEACLNGRPAALRPGQVRVILARRDAASGRPLKETEMVEVVWTVDAGKTDREVQAREGRNALRQQRIERLLTEAVEQDGAATQEDLAQVLQASVRTIKRDFVAMRAAGRTLPSRGHLRGIGRGQTHKAQIIARWMQGETYDQIAFNTRHAPASIDRYVETFLRVVQLHRAEWSEGQIAQLVQIGPALVSDYLAVYEAYPGAEERRRLEEQMQRLQTAPAVTPSGEKGGR